MTQQRRVQGKRGIKTDQIDLAAMCDLLETGRGLVVAPRSDALLQLQAWAAMRHRRLTAVIAVKNQLLGQMDRAFLARADVLPAVCSTSRSVDW